jgi:hypothetical protein
MASEQRNMASEQRNARNNEYGLGTTECTRNNGLAQQRNIASERVVSGEVVITSLNPGLTQSPFTSYFGPHTP